METKTFIAEEPISAHRFVKFGTGNTVVTATSSTDTVIGVSDDVNITAAGNVVDVHLCDCQKVQCGGTIKAGDLLTASDDGRAVKVTAGDNVVGVALDDATEDEHVYFTFRHYPTTAE